MSVSIEGFEGRNSAFDALTAPSLDERARQHFVSQLRKHIMVDMAASNPSTAIASVRAMIIMPPGSRRAAQATRIFCTMSSSAIRRLPAMWPQRFGNSWSSNWSAATPASS